MLKGAKYPAVICMVGWNDPRVIACSRLVIVLGINNNFRWQINYGTGKDVSDETINDAKIPLQIKWYTNSVIRVPVYK